MTGYLQRLAMSVQAPARLHPFVGPMFAGPLPEAVAPVLPHADLSAAPDDQVAATPAATDHAERAPAPALSPTVPAQVHRDMRQVQDPRDESPDSNPPDSDDARSDGAAAPRAGFRPLFATAEREAEFRATVPHDTANVLPAPSRAQPLMPSTTRRDPARETPAVLPRPAASLRDVEPPLASSPAALRRPVADERPAAARPRSSEDVHIHIGRVEVTAVPPPAPRPPAAPPRKTMTLEEYLGRRNGAPR
jgi:hypothetical protein